MTLLPRRRCPLCAEDILPAARKCKHCKAWLDDQAVQAADGSSGVEHSASEVLQAPAVTSEAPPSLQGIPVASVFLIVLLAARMVLEIVQSDGQWTGAFEIPLSVLIASGGSSADLVFTQGEYQRLFSAMFLHVDAMHLALNSWCIVQAGTVLEPQVGRLRYLLIFLCAGFAGSVVSSLLNGPSVVSVGASGGAMGLLAASFASSLRFPRSPRRDEIVGWATALLVLNILPLHNGVDYAAHTGGAAFGAFMVVLLVQGATTRVIAPAREMHWGVITALGAVVFTALLAFYPPMSPPAWADVARSDADLPATLSAELPDGVLLRPAPPDEVAQASLLTVVEPVTGSLHADESAEHVIELIPRMTYVIDGTCDDDCADLDLVAHDGEEILASDTEMDAYPRLTFSARRAGRAVVRVHMLNCSIAPCGYALRMRQLAPRYDVDPGEGEDGFGDATERDVAKRTADERAEVERALSDSEVRAAAPETPAPPAETPYVELQVEKPEAMASFRDRSLS
jgi:membrane associated rhomboid family serine protease